LAIGEKPSLGRPYIVARRRFNTRVVSAVSFSQWGRPSQLAISEKFDMESARAGRAEGISHAYNQEMASRMPIEI